MKDVKDFDDVRWDDGKPTVTDYVWGRDNQTASLIRAYKDEIERLREALQSTSTIIELMCRAFDLSPEDFVIKVNANKENGETRVVTSISAQEVLDKARAALGKDK